MTRKNSYRSLWQMKDQMKWLCAGALLVGVVGCELPERQTIKEEQNARWNETRLAVLLQLATQQYEVGDYDKCRESLKQAFSVGHPWAPISILAAKLDLEKGSLESASEHLKTATRLAADNPEPYYLLGVVYQRWQNFQTAQDYYKIAYEKKPGEALYLLAVVEMQISLGQLDEAQKLLEEKMVFFEQTAAMRVAMARLATLKGDHATACKYYREATILSADDATLRLNYAEALFFAERYADALPLLEELRGNGAITNKTNVLLILGQTYMHLHRPQNARTCLAEITRDNPHHKLACLYLGQATLEMRDYQQAAGIAMRILKSEPEYVPGLILLAVAQQKQEQWEASKATLAKARRLEPGNATVLCLMGLSAERLKQPEEAAKLYALVLDKNPNDAWAQELLAGVTPTVSANGAPKNAP